MTIRRSTRSDSRPSGHWQTKLPSWNAVNSQTMKAGAEPQPGAVERGQPEQGAVEQARSQAAGHRRRRHPVEVARPQEFEARRRRLRRVGEGDRNQRQGEDGAGDHEPVGGHGAELRHQQLAADNRDLGGHEIEGQHAAAGLAGAAALSQPSTTVNRPAWQKPMSSRRTNQSSTSWLSANTMLVTEQRPPARRRRGCGRRRGSTAGIDDAAGQKSHTVAADDQSPVVVPE